ncbi:MAG: MFS transporter, partial [Lentisphaeria bacterium]|nr:MFS transporter [Lentisphaeria bacterium]
MEPWQRNLRRIWFVQFFSIMGFALCMPIAPYYVQELGVTDPDRVKFWSSLFFAATPLTVAIMAPIWGILSDRHSRRMMLMRANVAGGVMLGAMAYVDTPLSLIVLRAIQGLLTGTYTAALTMVSANTPDDRQGSALGLLHTAVYSGVMFGGLAGGILGDILGYRACFLVAGGLLCVGALLTMTLTELPHPVDDKDVPANKPRYSLPMMVLLPLLMATFCMAFALQFDLAILPLYVQELHGQLAGSATITGTLNGIGGIASIISGVYLARFADRRHPALLGCVAAAGAGLFMLCMGLTSSFAIIFPARFAMLFFAGTLDPILQAWVARMIPANRRGFVLGVTVTIRALGWCVAPILAGWVAVQWNSRAVFYAGPLIFWLLLP